MPTEYEKYLTKRIRTYMWGSDTPPPIAMNHLTRPQNVGGRNILDLKAQNEAISIMKLKKLLDYSGDCPTASDTAIAIIMAAIPKSLQEKNNIENITRSECHNCKKYRKEGCTHPNACFNKASQILNDIAPKFTPQEDDHLLSEEITKDDRAVTIKNAIGPPEKIKIFNPDTTT